VVGVEMNEFKVEMEMKQSFGNVEVAAKGRNNFFTLCGYNGIEMKVELGIEEICNMFYANSHTFLSFASSRLNNLL
jgi:hypothetical protein